MKNQTIARKGSIYTLLNYYFTLQVPLLIRLEGFSVDLFFLIKYVEFTWLNFVVEFMW